MPEATRVSVEIGGTEISFETGKMAKQASGAVLSACAQRGDRHKMLKRASELAAYGARFSPTQLSGQPVKVTGVITYNFVAQ